MAGSMMAGSGAGSGHTADKFAMRVLTSGLAAPWEVTWGPDGQLWITERIGKRVVRVDPTNGQRTVALTVVDAHQSAGQDGVLGMALDPRLGEGVGGDYVYLAYTYNADPGDGLQRRTKLVRYSYDASSETLGSPLTLVAALPASNDHNSGRLAYGPDDRLYYTLGDQGKNQFDNMCQEIRAQRLPSQSEVDHADWSSYEGKVLRLALDGSIPSDNPVIGGVRSHVYSYGHRNAQGLVFSPAGKLYAAEHGPKTDDELNLIVGGKNYGWPFVAGFRDNMAYAYANWSASSSTPCSTLSYTDYQPPASVPTQRETDWSHPDFRNPLMTFYTVDDGFNFLDPACAGSSAEYVCWPTVAPSSLDFYVAGDAGLASWGTSLLVTSLKAGSVFRVQLAADGETTVGTPQKLFKTTNRYRDLAVAPDKRTFYVITDSDGPTSGPTRGTAPALDNYGAVLEFRHTP